MIRDYLLTIVQLVGMVQCLFIAIALLYLPGNRTQASRWLSALFCVWVLLFAHMVLRQNDLQHLAPLFSFFRLPLLFLSGPLLYLYLRQITEPWQELTLRGAASHLLAFGLLFCACLPALSIDRNGLLQMMYYPELRRLFPYTADLTATQEWLPWITGFVMELFVVQLLVYLVLCLRLLQQHKQRVREHFSRLDKVSLDWMRNLLFAVTVLWISIAASQLLFANTGIGRLINDVQTPLLVLFFSALGLYGLLQKNIPLPVQTEVTAAADVPVVPRYQNSMFTEPQLQRAADRLQAAMRNDKPYLDSELTLTSLAAQLALPARQLSQVINGVLGQNFVDFVNGYRVEEVKRLLADRSCASSVLTIAMEVGFNSKSAFYSAFKRHAGQTPSEFRRDCLAAKPADVPAQCGTNQGAFIQN